MSIFLLAFFIVWPLAVYAGPDDNPANIFIFTFSGLRNEESIYDEQYMRNFFSRIRPNGIMFTNLQAENFQFHMPAVQAINTGFTHSVYGGEFHPTLFQYYMEKYSLPRSKVWSIGHWAENIIHFTGEQYAEEFCPASLVIIEENKSELLNKILSTEELNFLLTWQQIYKRGISSWQIWDTIAIMQYKIFKKVLHVYEPSFVHYVLNGTDSAHFGNFARYAHSIIESDSQLGDFWDTIKQMQKYKDNTYVFITSDHGRNRYYMQHDQYDRPQETWLFMSGPTIKKDATVDSVIRHVDIFATIAYICNLKTDDSEGRILKEAFF